MRIEQHKMSLYVTLATTVWPTPSRKEHLPTRDASCQYERGWGGGVQTLCPLHHLPHKQAPRVRSLIEGVRAEREGLVVGVGVSRRVGEATNLRQRNGKRKQSRKRGQKQREKRVRKETAYIRAKIAQSSREYECGCKCEQHCARQCEY